jgi:hypothetical protein
MGNSSPPIVRPPSPKTVKLNPVPKRRQSLLIFCFKPRYPRGNITLYSISSHTKASMLTDPEVVEPSVTNPNGAHTLLEITAGGGARSMTIARLIIGVSSADEVSRGQQRHDAASLLQRLLSLTYPERCAAWALARRRSGAPYLEGSDKPAPPPRVSMAHAGTWAMAAISTAAIGVDIEQQNPGRNTAQLAEFMGWTLSGDSDAAFYHRWTMWEAYTKCREGRLFAPAGPEFEALYADSAAGRDRKARTWHGLHVQVADRVQAAVVVRTSEPVATTARSLDQLHARPW